MTHTWSADKLISALPEMDWSLSTPEENELWQQYLAHYALPKQSDGYRHYVGSMSLANFNIVVQVWQPKEPTATAYIVHGYYDHVGLYRHLIQYCLARNWRVVSFDLPGHGLSSGARSSINSFQEYDAVFAGILDQIQRHFSEPVHVFGQSTGGAIIVNYLLRRGLTAATSPFKSVNLMAPLVRPKQWRKAFWLHRFIHPWIKQLSRGRSINSSDQAFLDFLWHQDPLQANLLSVVWVGAMKEWVRFIEAQPSTDISINLVQGNDDNTVAWQHNLAVLTQKFPRHNIKMIEMGRHHLANENSNIRHAIWHFFDEVIGA